MLSVADTSVQGHGCEGTLTLIQGSRVGALTHFVNNFKVNSSLEITNSVSI